MSHGGPSPEQASIALEQLPVWLQFLERLMRAVNGLVMFAGGLALVAASLVLTHCVIVRYILRAATDWQDEMAVFLIIGAAFLSAAAVQARRGHVAIEAFTSYFDGAASVVRRVVVDLLSLVFCSYFAFKCAQLLHEAIVDNQRTESSWAPPLWIPYGLMTAGFALLSLQLALQVATRFAARRTLS
jgi:TRAP-type C4-dicarboxylate transport system permease small subunit